MSLGELVQGLAILNVRCAERLGCRGLGEEKKAEGERVLGKRLKDDPGVALGISSIQIADSPRRCSSPDAPVHVSPPTSRAHA